MELWILAIFLAFASCDANERSRCPPLYQEVGDQCFYISVGDECWSNAFRYCFDMGAQLAVPHDVEALKKFAFTYTKRRGVWIGGTDSSSEGDWSTYINGETIQGGDWYPGQPSDYAEGEDCLEVRNSFSPPLNDLRCSYSQPFVCEVPRTLNIPTCTPPATLLGDECFQVVDTDLDWDAARVACQSAGGDLAMPYNVSDFYSFVLAELGGDHVWVGANDRDENNNWKWLNGDPIYFNDWAEDQPNNYGGGQECLELNTGLNDETCSIEQPYVCEFDPVYE